MINKGYGKPTTGLSTAYFCYPLPKVANHATRRHGVGVEWGWVFMALLPRWWVCHRVIVYFNENKELFTNFCSVNQYVIVGSTLQYKRILKATCEPPDYKTPNQMCRICIKKQFRSSLHDAKAFRGGVFNSDHHLLIDKIKEKIQNII